MRINNIDYGDVLKFNKSSYKNINFTVLLRDKQLKNNNYINNIKRWQRQFFGKSVVTKWDVKQTKQTTELAHGKSLHQITKYKRNLFIPLATNSCDVGSKLE